MGCDIHIVLERKIGDKWIGIDAYRQYFAPQMDQAYVRTRNYKRFAKLAGVRGDGPEPKGLPEDLSDLAKMLSDDWDLDGHSHSWASLLDALPIFIETEWFDIEHQSDYAKKYPASYFFNVYEDELKGKDYRIVFWFDN